VSSGEIVITQNDMLKEVFMLLNNTIPLDKNKKKHLIQTMMEYQQSLYVLDIDVNNDLQQFCLSLLLEIKEFQYMQMLLNNGLFTPTLETANYLLLAWKNGCVGALQNAIDMFHKMKKSDEVIKILLANGKVKEVLAYVEEYKIKGVSVKEILEAAHKLPTRKEKMYIEYFMQTDVILRITDIEERTVSIK